MLKQVYTNYVCTDYMYTKYVYTTLYLLGTGGHMDGFCR